MCMLAILSFQSCALMIHGTKATLGLHNAPKDLEVTNVNTGEKLPIHILSVGASKSGGVTTIYKGPGVKVKATKDLTLQFKSGNVTKTKVFGYKHNIGFLIIEGFLTLGIGTIVDLATGANREVKPTNIDVPTLLQQ